MDLNKIFEDLKQKKWVWVVYVLLTIPINLLLALPVNCLAFILMGLVTFGIPYLFGVRSVRTFLKVGTLIIIITGILFGAIYNHFMYNQMFYYIFEQRTVSDTQLVEGAVTPYLGNETTSFNYTVRYIGTESNTNITVYVNITDTTGKLKESIPLKHADGLYYNETALDKDIYSYYFVVNLNSTGEWLTTDPGFGPITVPYSESLTTNILYGVISMFLNSGIFFYMFLAIYYWRKSAVSDKMKMEEDLSVAEKEKTNETVLEEEEVKDVKGEFTCTACGADVDADADRCPNCGEEFEEEDETENEDEDHLKKS